MKTVTPNWNDLPYGLAEQLRESGYNYEYPQTPEGQTLDLRPGSKTHDELVKLVLSCARQGYDDTSTYVPEYKTMDRVLDGYMEPDALDRQRKTSDPRKPVNVVIPMLSAHRAMFLVAMQRDLMRFAELHRFQGEGSPERAAKAAVATKLLARITHWFKERRACDIHWGDAFGYGRAYMYGKWSKQLAPALVEEEIDEILSMLLGAQGVDFAPGDIVRYIDDAKTIAREGTEWIPLDPYQVLTDPSVTPDRFQDSGYFGWATDTNALLLLEQEPDPEEKLFNCRGLQMLAEKGCASSTYWREHEGRTERMGSPQDTTTNDYDYGCHVIHKFVRVIPKRYGLADSDKPAIYKLAVGGDRVLIQCDRVRTLHGGIPVVCTAPNARGHEIAPVSNLMITLGQQIAVDFSVKQRLDFQDMVMNGKFIINPKYLEWRDFKQGGGPMVVRMKKAAMGMDINQLYHQIQTEDVTLNNWTDVNMLMQLAKEGNGINEPASALPDRPTATGIEAFENRSLGQMGRVAGIIDVQSRIPMAHQGLCNTAQWMDTEVILDIVGRDDEIIRQGYGLPPGATGLLVGGWDIDPGLDVVPLSAMHGGQRNVVAMTEFAKTLLGAPGALEAFLQRFRLEEFLTSYFREMGISDIDWYRMNVTPATNEQVLNGLDAGNLVPMSELAGASQGVAA